MLSVDELYGVLWSAARKIVAEFWLSMPAPDDHLVKCWTNSVGEDLGSCNSSEYVGGPKRFVACVVCEFRCTVLDEQWQSFTVHFES